MDAVLRDRLSMIAALGAGVVVGLSGIYMYYKVNRSVSRELTQLTGTIESLRREIEELKRHAPHQQQPPEKKSVSQKQSTSSGSGVRFGTAHSSSSLEDEEDEFFDFTDVDDKSTNGTGSDEEEAAFDLPSWLEGVDVLLDGTTKDREGAYTALKSREEQFSSNVDFLWRLAKATHLHRLVAQKTGDAKLKEQLSNEAHDAAKRALEFSKNHPEVHKWYAITLGALGEYVSVNDKIRNGFIFKEHVDLAIKLKAKDPTLHHLLGRWCYEVSVLSWLERRLASSLFTAPPESSLSDARLHLLKADELLPRWKENMLYIAKSYVGDGDYAIAITWVDRAIAIPAKTEDDEMAHEELEILQNKLKGFRS